MVLGEAVPRDDSEAVTIAVTIPGEKVPEKVTVRRGFVGRLPLREVGSQGYEGRQLDSVEISGWNGDEPNNVRMDWAWPR